MASCKLLRTVLAPDMYVYTDSQGALKLLTGPLHTRGLHSSASYNCRIAMESLVFVSRQYLDTGE